MNWTSFANGFCLGSFVFAILVAPFWWRLHGRY